VNDLSPGGVTRLLANWKAGDDRALEELMSLVYGPAARRLPLLSRRHETRDDRESSRSRGGPGRGGSPGMDRGPRSNDRAANARGTPTEASGPREAARFGGAARWVESRPKKPKS
jgi:hypothetical protein